MRLRQPIAEALSAALAPLLLAALFCTPGACGDKKQDPCAGRQCGFWSGQDCGSCAQTDYCDQDGLCVPACGNVECGTWNGVDCGLCPACRACSPQGFCEPDPRPPPPPCPDPPSDEICINGWARFLFDPSDSRNFLTASAADPDASEDATRFAVLVYDMLAYTLDPQNTAPLAVSEVHPGCGTFRALDIPVPPQRLILLVTEDLDNQAEDALAFAGVPYEILQGENLTRIEAAAVTRDQVLSFTAAIGDAYLQAAGCPQSSDLLSCGTWIGVYRRGRPDEPGMPVEGVIPEGPVADLPAEATFYPGVDSQGRIVFDSAEPGTTWSDDGGPHEWTGILGTVFSPALHAGNLRGRCARDTPCEASECTWLPAVGGSIPGLLTVQFMWSMTCTDP